MADDRWSKASSEDKEPRLHKFPPRWWGEEYPEDKENFLPPTEPQNQAAKKPDESIQTDQPDHSSPNRTKIQLATAYSGLILGLGLSLYCYFGQKDIEWTIILVLNSIIFFATVMWFPPSLEKPSLEQEDEKENISHHS